MERKSRPGLIRRMLTGLWRGVDRLRQISLNLLFIAVAVFLIAGWWASRPTPLEAGSALLVAPVGQIVEQRTSRSPMSVLQGGDGIHQVQLRDIVDGIRAAAADSRIKALVIEPDGINTVGLSKLQEIAAAIAEFRKAGKKVYVHAKHYSQSQYYLAAQADEAFMNPDGYVFLAGFARYPTYYKGLLDSLGVRMQIFRVGTYKSFVEPYTRSDMSPEDREASRGYLEAAWQIFRQDIAAARPKAADKLDAYINDANAQMAAAGGDAARMARDAGLLDGLKTADEWRDFLKARVGTDGDGKQYRHVDLAAYLAHVREAAPHPDERVGVVVAQGAIVDGDQPAGVVGGDTAALLIRQARENDAIKALVLRVDSPGGSAFASEVIRRELELTRKAGKPVIVSMSSVAASGGYWISTAADEVWASPATLTGSIGIFAMVPDLSGPMNKLGLTVDGFGTTPLAGGLDPRRPLDPKVADLLQQSIDHGYKRFLQVVARGRRMTPEAVDPIAQGRVWLGTQAKEKGLVDKLGGLDEAVKAAAARAGLTRYDVTYVEKSLSPRDQLLTRLLDSEEESRASAAASPVDVLLANLRGELANLAHWNDPGFAYLHCLCVAP